MRATPPPTALHIAAMVTSVLAMVLVPSAVPSTALAERWLRPVPGEVARSFSYSRAAPFAAGAHRGLDLAAPPGAAVRAACRGRVAHAGAVAGRSQVVSVLCGARRVTHLPLATVTVRAGQAIRAGAPIGTLAGGHGGLHLGVRRAADPFGYENPLALLRRPDRPLAPIATRPRRIGRPRPLRLPRPAPPARVPRIAPAPLVRRAAPAPAPTAPTAGGSPPWVVWVGGALVACGAVGSRSIVVRRRRRHAVAGALRTSTPR